MMKKIAVVTGANRGLGWGVAQELSRQGYELMLTARDLSALQQKVDALKTNAPIHLVKLDLSQESSVDSAAQKILAQFPGGIDLLINNAGVFLESSDGSYDAGRVKSTLQTNALGPLQLTELLGPALKAKRGVVVNVSSGMGSLQDMGASYPGYRLSKTALNAATRYLAAEWRGAGVKVNSVCPGWVKTDMGGAGAARELAEGVASILWAAMIDKDGPTGGFFRDGKKLAW